MMPDWFYREFWGWELLGWTLCLLLIAFMVWMFWMTRDMWRK